MMKMRLFSGVMLSMALIQKYPCYAFASHALRNSRNVAASTNPKLWGDLARGGSSWSNRLSSSSTPTESMAMKEDSSYLADKAMAFLPVAGSSVLKSFGGLKYRDGSSEENVVFVLGGPGAGKGTQSELLLENYPCVHLSAGQLLREETTKKDSPHASLIEECLVAGKIVPVEISLSLLQKAMQESSGKSLVFLVDGFPRNFDNLEGWTRCMSGVACVSGVLVYQCPLSILEKRILERGKASGRSDDNIESLRKRFKTFQDETSPVIEALRIVQDETLLQVFDVSGDQPLEQVWKDTQKVMNSIIANDVLAANMKLLEAIEAGDVDLYRNLTAGEMYDGNRSPAEVMLAQEGRGEFPDIRISNAELDFIAGTKVSLSYERASTTGKVRETRVWSHQGTGWKMVHFSRALE